ncbi:hypothetical protein F2P56_003988 [Juglans regia]|uniref:RNase H type-1 domain-containing protein n=2 Tax=Juglans regia TaxID=51240 RepID=A0A834D141_JUGRE|nr:ribonuclease H-like [Juglans regia]KAF5477339.1 hypothetical protein F2P56_003988 [Juglans regia]
MDGSCRGNPSRCGGGGVIRDSNGRFVAVFVAFLGQGTNNLVELRALLAGLKLCRELGFMNIEIECDSQVVVDWVTARKARSGNVEEETVEQDIAREGEPDV